MIFARRRSLCSDLFLRGRLFRSQTNTRFSGDERLALGPPAVSQQRTKATQPPLRFDAGLARSGLHRRNIESPRAQIELWRDLLTATGARAATSLHALYQRRVIAIGDSAPNGSSVGLARIFRQDADLWLVLGEPGRARPVQPIDHSIGKTGMPEMAGQNEPETAEPNPNWFALLEHLELVDSHASASDQGRPGEISGLVQRPTACSSHGVALQACLDEPPRLPSVVWRPPIR